MQLYEYKSIYIYILCVCVLHSALLCISCHTHVYTYIYYIYTCRYSYIHHHNDSVIAFFVSFTGASNSFTFQRSYCQGSPRAIMEVAWSNLGELGETQKRNKKKQRTCNRKEKKETAKDFSKERLQKRDSQRDLDSKYSWELNTD